jgi:hypothetical protein
MNQGSSYDEDEDSYWQEHEISQLERALEDKGQLQRGELGELVGCKYWGPGRYSRALRAAVQEGRISRVARGRYGPSK